MGDRNTVYCDYKEMKIKELFNSETPEYERNFFRKQSLEYHNLKGLCLDL